MVIFASDIHGRVAWTSLFLERVKALAPEKIILLGDYLYNGPRNGVPSDYDPWQVHDLLNSLPIDKVVAIRGNCDSRVDDMLLKFRLKNNRVIRLFGRRCDLYHGDDFSLKKLAPKPGDLLLSGHTHVYVLKKENGFFYCNPGSISFPKNGNPTTFAVFDGKTIQIIALESGACLASLTLDA